MTQIELQQIIENIENKYREDFLKVKSLVEELDLSIQVIDNGITITKQINKAIPFYPSYANSIGYYDDRFGYLFNKYVNSKRDVIIDVKDMFVLLKDYQVKVVSFYRIDEVRKYLHKISGIELPYMSSYDREDEELVIKKFKNGNMIYQLTEIQYNYLKELIA